MTEHYHRHMYAKAREHALTQTELVALCQVVAGAPPNRLTPEQARFVLNAMIAKGEGTKAWAQELLRSL